MTGALGKDLLQGGCQCGAVRYALDEMPVGQVCHCRMCQKAVGGPFAALGEIAVEAITWTRGAPTLFESSNMARRGFCGTCGTPLTYQALDSSRIEVSLGSLDDPQRVAPRDQTGIESRLAWLADLPTLPATSTHPKFAGVKTRQHTP